MSTNSRSLILIRLIGEKSKVIFHISYFNFSFFKWSSYWSNCSPLIGQNVVSSYWSVMRVSTEELLIKQNDISIWVENFMLSN